MLRRAKPLLKGVSKTRAGKPSIGLQTYVDRLNKVSSASFRDELEKIAWRRSSIEKQIERDRATEAIRTVREGGPRQHLEAATVSGTLGPGVLVASRAARGLVEAKSGGRGKALKSAIKGLTRGDFAQSAVGSGLTGAGISLGRGGIGRVRAKKVIDTMGLEKHTRDKAAGFGTVVMPPKPPSAPPVPKGPKALPKIRPAINPYKTVHQTMKM